MRCPNCDGDMYEDESTDVPYTVFYCEDCDYTEERDKGDSD